MRHAVGFLMKQISDKIKVSVDASLKSKNLTLADKRRDRKPVPHAMHHV